MNNQEKNTYIREQLTKALIQLLQEKRIEDISVSELTQRAQVGRASFYMALWKVRRMTSRCCSRLSLWKFTA